MGKPWLNGAILEQDKKNVIILANHVFGSPHDGGLTSGKPASFCHHICRNGRIDAARQERAFYDMSGEKNVYEYINAEKKRRSKKAKTVQEYFDKNHGVFNGDGFLSPMQVEEMKKRAQDGKKNIWHGFVSINKENSYMIEKPEQCMRLVKRNFGLFFREMGLDPKNVDLLCALHLDREKHYHIHFAFWEKAPKCKYRKKETEYRHKGKIEQKVIDNMRVRLYLYVRGQDGRSASREGRSFATT